MDEPGNPIRHEPGTVYHPTGTAQPTGAVAPSIQAPTPPAASPTVSDPFTNNAANIVWGWVCYALWEWELIALSFLLTSILTYYFDNTSTGSNDYTYKIY